MACSGSGTAVRSSPSSEDTACSGRCGGPRHSGQNSTITWHPVRQWQARYLGTALRQGSSGQNVRLVQFWLKIATVYPSLNTLTVDGKFGGRHGGGSGDSRAVCLTSDGVVGRTTWNKLYEVYNDIANRLLSQLAPRRVSALRRGSTETAVRSCSSTSTR